MDIDRNLIWEAWQGQRPPADSIKTAYMSIIRYLKNEQWPPSPESKDPAAWAAVQLTKMFNNLIKYYIDLDPNGPAFAPSDREYVEYHQRMHEVAVGKLYRQLDHYSLTGEWDIDITTLIKLEDLFDNIWGIHIRQNSTSEDYPGLG